MNRLAPYITVLIAAAQAMAQPPTRQAGQIEVGDATIRYVATGRGYPIVFIHGWAQQLEIWDNQAAAFSRDYRVIRYDARGFGGSTGHADATADPDDLRLLLDSLGVQRAHIVGLSRGSGIALRFAVLFPERVMGLVLYGQGPLPGFTPMPRLGLVATFREIATKYGLDSLGKHIAGTEIGWMPPERPDLRDSLLTWWAAYKGRDLFDPRPESGRTRRVTMDDVNGIRAPTLLVHGDHEMPLFQSVADTLLTRLPRARKVVIVNGGHGAHFAQPESFNRELRVFFASLEGRR